MRITRYAVLIICSIITLTSHSNSEDPRSSSEFYIEAFGRLSEQESPQIKRVDAVFERLLRVANKAQAKDPELLLINSDNWPWAVALPDNTVVLSKGVIQFCYEDVTPEQGDTRIAMIIGHELAHLAEDDYWHRDVYLSLVAENENRDSDVFKFIGERSGLIGRADPEWADIVKDREIKADDMGFLYTALAGFDTRFILDIKGQSFFQYWKNKTQTQEDQYHLSADDRTIYAKTRFKTLSNLSELFHVGVALIYLDYLDQAEVLFKKILVQFPAYEVYNNLGYIYLIKSGVTSHVPGPDLFWLPTFLEFSAQTPILSRGIARPGFPEEVEQNLKKAAGYFELSLEKHPGYLGAALNLASVNFYLGKYNKVAAILSDAKEQYPDNLVLDEISNLALYMELKDKVNMTDLVINELKKILKTDPERLSVHFNLAKIYEENDQQNKAKEHWSYLSQHQDQLTDPYQMIVFKYTDNPNTNKSEAQLDLDGLTDFIASRTQEAGTSAHLAKLGRDNLYRISYPENTFEYRNEEHVFFSALTLPTSELKQQLDQCCSKPKQIIQTAIGEIWSYAENLTVLLNDATHSEVWLR